MERFIKIDGTPRPFKASGATPRLYRGICGRDLFVDLVKLETEEYSAETLMIYEDLAYTMAKQGNDALPDTDERKIQPFPATPDEWLDGIQMLDIYDVMPQIAAMFRESEKTTVSSKKKTE